MKTFDELRAGGTQELSNEELEEGVGKISSGVLLARLKGLTKRIRDKPTSQSLFNIGMMVSGVSLQIPNIKNMEKELKQVKQQNVSLKTDVMLLQNQLKTNYSQNVTLKNKLEMVMTIVNEIKREVKK